MLTIKMLHFDMPSEFFAAISIKVTVRTLQNTTGSTIPWRNFECLFSVTFKAGKSLERTWEQMEELDYPKFLDRKSWTASKMSKNLKKNS